MNGGSMMSVSDAVIELGLHTVGLYWLCEPCPMLCTCNPVPPSGVLGSLPRLGPVPQGLKLSECEISRLNQLYCTRRLSWHALCYAADCHDCRMRPALSAGTTGPVRGHCCCCMCTEASQVCFEGITPAHHALVLHDSAYQHHECAQCFRCCVTLSKTVLFLLLCCICYIRCSWPAW